MLSPKGALAKSGEGSNSSKSIRWGNVGTLPTGLSDTELLEHFTKRLPENQETLKKPLTLCEQLELLQSQTEIGNRLCDFMDSIPKAPAERHQEVEGLMKTISKQKAAMQTKKESTSTVVHSRSAPALARAERPDHVLSTVHGSASYSFGKPVHGKGKFKIPVLQVRDPEYGMNTASTPGAGEYSLPPVSFPEVVEHGGSQTGGWKYVDHKAFMERLKLHKHKPTRGFFEHLYHEMPHISSVEIIDHVHWLADYMYHLAQKQWNLDTFIDEKEQLALVQQTGKLPSLEEQQQKLLMRRQEVLAERRKRETLHGFADMEERRLKIKRRVIADELQPQQRFEGEVVESNLRGPHPGLQRSVGYTWCNSRDRRDLQSRKMTDLSHVRSSSHLDVPGPGQYIGLEEQSRPMKKAPEWSLRIKHPPPKVDAKAVFGPGYDPLQVVKDLKWISHSVNKPEWTFPKEHARAHKMSNEKHALQDKLSSPPEVGPGKYIHPSSLHTQFPYEAERHRKQRAM